MVKLGQILNIRPNEQYRVALFFSVLLIFSLGASFARSIGMTLLVGQLGAEALPIIFISIDIAVMLGTILYAKLSRHLEALPLLIFLLGGLAAFSIIIQQLFVLVWGYAAFFIGFSFLFIIISIHITTLLPSYFTVTQMKRLSGVIYSGIPLGGICGGSLLVWGLQMLSPEQLLHNLWISCIIVMLLLRYIQYHINPILTSKHKAKRHNRSQRISVIWHYIIHTKLLLTMALTVFIYVVISRLMEYQYQGIIYPQAFPDLTERAAFFGHYEIIANSIALLLQIFLSSRIIMYLGVGASNLIYPVLQFLVAIMLIFRFGFVPGVIAQFVNQEMRTTIRAPAFQLLFNALPPEQWSTSKAFLNGLIYPLATITASGFLLLAKEIWTPNTLVEWLPIICGMLSILAMLIIMPQWRHYNQGMFALLSQDSQQTQTKTNLAQEIDLALNSHDKTQVMAALQMISTLNNEVFIHDVGKILLHTDDFMIKRQAMMTLTQCPHSGASLIYMNKAIKFEGDPQMLVLLLRTLQRFEDEPLEHIVQRFLLHPYPEVFSAVILCLHHNSYYQTKSALIKQLTLRLKYAPQRHIPCYLKTLGETKNSALTHIIEPYLTTPNDEVRIAALEAVIALTPAHNRYYYQSYFVNALSAASAVEQHLALIGLKSCTALMDWQPVIKLLSHPSPFVVKGSQALLSLNINACKAALITAVFEPMTHNKAKLIMLFLLAQRLNKSQQKRLQVDAQCALQDYITLQTLRLLLHQYSRMGDIEKRLIDKALVETADQALYSVLMVVTYYAQEDENFLQQTQQSLSSGYTARRSYALEVLANVKEKALTHDLNVYFDDMPTTLLGMQQRYQTLFNQSLVVNESNWLMHLQQLKHPVIRAGLDFCGMMGNT